MTQAQPPLILATNDDGISAPGLRALVEVMQELGDVVVVAPDGPQSGMGHAITINNLLRIDKVDLHPGSEAYQCSGTPVDCVKMAIDRILPRKPDLLVSGINHGANHSINVLYSGTMSAAMEGAIEGIVSVGFSNLNYRLDADMTAAKYYVRTIARNMLQFGMPTGTLLNVNIPNLPIDQINGVKVCRQAIAKWEEEFFERKDPTGRNYYWLTGRFQNYDKGTDTDVWALENGYVSAVPVQFDLTAYHAMQRINEWDFSL